MYIPIIALIFPFFPFFLFFFFFFLSTSAGGGKSGPLFDQRDKTIHSRVYRLYTYTIHRHTYPGAGRHDSYTAHNSQAARRDSQISAIIFILG